MTLTILSLFALSSVCFAQTDTPTLLQKPAFNGSQIVFSYAGDLWIVSREGGAATRLTTGVGDETNPVFSPDGAMIAFTGEYDGNTDVYVVPATGGSPKRLTWHPGADLVSGWTNDGKRVLFASSRNSHSGFPRLFTVGLDAGFPEEVPLPMAERGSYSPDGAYIAYEPLAQWQPEWKRYRGGQQDVIWIARLSDSSIEKLPHDKSNDRYPMWVGEKIYFLSDRNGGYSLFSFDTKTKKVTELVKNNGIDIKSASAFVGAGAGVIAYEQFGSVYLYDIKSNRSHKVNISVAADVATMRPRFEKVGNRISNARISPTGARAVFEARGEIITVPAEKGDSRNITNTTGVMERDPAWSPDGKWIAYFSDESGEYALYARDQKGEGEVKKIALPPTFYNSPMWSPDSKKIAFRDKKLQLWYLEIEKGAPVKVDDNPIGLGDSVMTPAWSPDSRWIAYAKQLPNLLRAIFIYSLETGKTHQITDGMSDARYPAFDKSGKYLYFTASTDIGPGISFADLSGIAYRSTRSVYAAVLRNDIPSPLAPESDEEKVAEEKTSEKKEGETGGQGDKEKGQGEEKKADAQAPAGAPKPSAKKEEPTRIDLEGIDQRVIALPIPARDYVNLTVGKANLIYVLEQPVAPAGPGQFGLTIHKYDLEKRKFDKALDGVTAFEISANGEKALYRQGNANWIIASTATLGAPMGPGGAPGGPNILKTSEMEVYVDPKVEWKQMYNEVWRNERDFFYDRNLHGLNLEEMKKRYASYLGAVGRRSDLTYLFTEMLNQLTVGHMFIGGGDQPRPDFVPGGLLGCDYKVENGRYRFAKIYNGENWNPNLRAPLTQPGVNVKEGEYLLAVGGRNLTAADNVYSFFESKANKQVVIKVGPNPYESGSREVTVLPVGNEQGLRNLAWIEGNRRKVDQLSGGKLAYIYMPNTGDGGYTSFNRYFFSQTNKDGAVLDERFNGGGLLADYVVQLFSRQQLSQIYFREGRQDVPVPAGAIYGPKAMIINELAGSGGDAMPWFFRKAKIGPLIGKRTWGGLIASFRPPPLMDGGFHTAPDAAVYGLNGEWEVENVGVGPDIEVEFDPAAWRQGRDPQLERTVEYLMEELKKNPRPQYKRPPFPNYHQGNPVTPTGQDDGRTGQN
ncbi:MAG: PD40 domain-containing protein [Chloracidobacterium sp.]|nr:PD40 domain-containing protein [Chloracidobacterium sp.]